MATRRLMLATILATLGWAPWAGAATPVGTAFTYQGELMRRGEPVSGRVSFVFTLWDSPEGGRQIGTSEEKAVLAENGRFSVLLDFSDSFGRNQRFLEIGIDGPGGVVPLAPRQPITPAPVAVYAVEAGSAGGGVSPWTVSGSDVYYNNGRVGVGTAKPAYPFHAVSPDGPVLVGENPDRATIGQLGGDNAGVYGEVAVGYGVYGQTARGTGVYGQATGTSGTGVEGHALSPTGYAVHGRNEAESGNAIAVFGETGSRDGFGGYFSGKGYFSGMVGIGTEDPTEKLDVVGTVKMTGLRLGTTAKAGDVLTTDANGAGTWQALPPGPALLWQEGPENQIFYGDGYVGIGTGVGQSLAQLLHVEGNAYYSGSVGIGARSPTEKLEVNGTVKMTGLQLGDSATAGHILTADANGVGTWRAPPADEPEVWQDGPGSDIFFDVGFVGINTQEPRYPLDVAGTVKMTGLRLGDTTRAGYVLTADVNGFGTWRALPASGSDVWRDGPGDDIFFDDGRVGINTQEPRFPLDVAGVVRMTGFRLGNSATAGHVLTADSDGVGTWRAPPAGGSDVWRDGPGADIFFEDGRVGINTQTPDYPLDVGGTVRMTGLRLGDSATAGHVLTADANGFGTWQAASESPWQGQGPFGDIYYEGQVGIGTTNPQYALHVDSASGSTAVKVTNTHPTGQNAAISAEVESSDGRAVKGYATSTSDEAHPTGIFGRSYSPTGYGVNGTNLDGGAGVYGEGKSNTAGWAGFFDGRGYFSGNVGIGVGREDPQEKLDVNGTVRMSGFRLGTTATPGHVLTADANGVGTWQAPTGGSGGDFNLPYDGTVDADGQAALHITNTGSGVSTRAIKAVINNAASDNASAGYFLADGPGSAIQAESGNGTTIYATGDGRVFKGTSSGSGAAEFISDADGGYGVKGVADSDSGSLDNRGGWFKAVGLQGRGVYAEATGGSGVAIDAKATGGESYGILAESPWVGISAKGGRAAARLYGNVYIYEHGTTTVAVALGKGLDYAEGFDVSTDDTEIKPGTVLIIDPDNPGELAISRTAYDRKVAGIVAGAKGLGSGVRLGGDQFDHDVALAGRVYCNAVATDQPIEPGDLLTTSDLPGFAMKVTDHQRAQGAILGKAMQRLAKGEKGQILVLVMPQ